MYLKCNLTKFEILYMTEQKGKSTNPIAGYFLIAAGIFGILSQFSNNFNLSLIGFIKLSISLVCIGYGLWIIF